MAMCKKCWADAFNRAFGNSKTQAEAYEELINEHGPHPAGGAMIAEDRITGYREAAEIARNFRPKSACTCGGYISFHNGIPSHQPGCLVGECLELAEEIEARADELERRGRGA